MPLFQKSILNKYLNEQDKGLLENQFVVFKKYFQNNTIQKNIIASKEEEFQEGFLRELFVKVFGYIINPEPSYNLVTELKNEKDSKKADGAILKDEKAIAVIELKSTTTTDLNKIEIQAFNYKNNQKDCKYVITSNFQKIRFYIDNATEFLEWNLFKLDFENFKVLYLCLCKENLLNDIPATIKKESLIEEENITKRLYKEYSSFRKTLFNSIVELNPNTDKLLLFKKTQKLLDRFLFLFFAEDRMLVPPNSVRLILDQWNSLKDMDAYVALYDRFKLYFGYLNTGHKGKLHEIFAYNGGLFATDEVLDNIKIDDEILYNATFSLSRYDYNSDVDVNILGHIFEHSLTEIEELETEITSMDLNPLDKKLTKRKKDGVFYTPKYITKYIVENTVGTLCKNKKDELSLQEEDYHTLTKKEKKKLYTTLLEYKTWLLQITIVDPACGSGAFINQALEFLIAEHKWISELEANITGSSIVFDIENSILENNLFGVDINEESVEIAKLSLWLRTAKKGRKLNNLNNNIKCGNSLIDDVNVAGDKAFNWHKEFPQVFSEYIEAVEVDNEVEQIRRDEKPIEVNINNESEVIYKERNYLNIDNRITNDDFNIINESIVEYNAKPIVSKGFDVVIGNPPYVPTELIKEVDKKYLSNKYQSAFGRINLYPVFYELGLTILKENGVLGFITPYTILKKARKFILNNSKLRTIIDFTGLSVFEEAAVDSIVLILDKVKEKTYDYKQITKIDSFENNKYIIEKLSIKEVYEKNDLCLLQNSNKSLLAKLYRNKLSLKDIVNFSQGIITGNNKKFILNTSNELTKRIITGSDFNKYSLSYKNQHIVYDTSKLHRPRKTELFEVKEKILIRQTSSYPICTIDKQCFYTLDTVHNGILINNDFSLTFIMVLLNSNLLKFLYSSQINEEGKVFAQVKIIYIDPLPIPKIDIKTQQPFIDKAEIMLAKNEKLQKISEIFIQLLIAKFENININTKLEKWYNLSFAEFSKELNKQKIKLSLQQESEWLQYFEQEKQKAISIKKEIDTTDKQIDKMVYELYGLTDDEIKVVENS